MRHAAQVRAEHCRDMAAHLRCLAEIEPLLGLRRHLRRLAAQHDELAADLEIPNASKQDLVQTAQG
jgi:hypothetical protein